MNNGAFGENFPYSNFHDLNMDWIIKIAKDFLDQYTHIQEIIEQGKVDIQELTDSGLDQLQDKADNLQELLQSWYDEHSTDIAEQLASALTDLNTWYTQHETFLDSYVATAIIRFNSEAEAKAQQTIASIPDDYSTIASEVAKLNGGSLEIATKGNIFTGYTESGRLDNTTGAEVSTDAYIRSGYIEVLPNKKLYLLRTDGTLEVRLFFYDAEYNFIPPNILSFASNTTPLTTNDPIPNNAKYLRVYKSVSNTASLCLSYEYLNSYVEYTGEKYYIKNENVTNSNLTNPTAGDISKIDIIDSQLKNTCMELFNKYTQGLSFNWGRYIDNGYNLTLHNYCVADGMIEEGTYDFPEAPTGYEYCIYYYDSDISGTLYYNWSSSAKTKIPIDRNAKITFRRTNQATLYTEDIQDLSNTYHITKYPNSISYVDGINRNVLKELYIPNETGWTLERIRAYDTWYRIGIKLSDNTIIINGLSDVGTTYSDKVQRFINPNTGEILGYYILHYTGTDYDTPLSSYTPITENTSNLNRNPIIKEYITRKENLVLIGDSIFGYGTENMLEPILASLTNKQVFNCGFGGCTMAKRTGTGASLNPFSFAELANSIYERDFSIQHNAMGENNTYPYRYANLTEIDFTKPTTIILMFGNNDLTSSVPLGNLWEYTDTQSSWDTYKFTEAMTYGINKILSRYPQTRIIFMTTKWRFLEVNNTKIPPYAYQNSISLTAIDYNNALKDNAERIGVPVFDMFKQGCSNAFNSMYMNIDGLSHFTVEGYEHFARILNELDKSDIG